MTAKSTKNIMLICSGNVFRSASAEHLLRQRAGTDSHYRFSSSGTKVNWEKTDEELGKNVHPAVLNHLSNEYGIDLSYPNHIPRFYHPGLIDQDEVDLIVAMHGEHYRFLKADQEDGDIEYDIPIVYYNEVVHFRQHGILDVPDVFPDPKDRPARAVRSFIETQIDYIAATSPAFLKNLPQFLNRTDGPEIDPSLQMPDL